MASSSSYDDLDEDTLIEDLEATLEPDIDEIEAELASGEYAEDDSEFMPLTAALPSNEAASASAPEAHTWPASEEDAPEESATWADLGALRVGDIDGSELRVNTGEYYVDIVWPALPATIRLRVLAAPTSGALWDGERADLMLETAQHGGHSHEVACPWGTALQAWLPGITGVGVPVRYVGIDGPRWMLLASLHDRAAQDDMLGQSLLASVFAKLVVCRGSAPHPPGEALGLKAPEVRPVDELGGEE